MTPPSITLDALEHDALCELVNIGVSRAAAGLGKMVGDQVLLSVPAVEVVSRGTAAALIRERESDELVAVRQDFTGVFSGRALLIFPEANSLALVRAVIRDEASVEELRNLEVEALAETGNVVLNGCLATMANMLQQPLSISLPEVIRGDGQSFFELNEAPTSRGVVLFLYINFAINGRDIRGYIAMLLDMPSLEILKVLISEFVRRVMGTDDLRKLN
jgi:chemotaxis protein CheC